MVSNLFTMEVSHLHIVFERMIITLTGELPKETAQFYRQISGILLV